MIKDLIFYFYGYVVFFYSMGLIISYVILMWLAEIGIFRKKRGPLSLYTKQIIEKSPYTPGVSIIAPAYNEERTVVNNVNSLLGQDYPTFEVVIVNDGSTDKTLDLLIEKFELVEVPFAYVEYIRTKPYRRLFKSTNPEYRRLVVVDKENGGTKADAVNAGLNASSYPYFINIDVDGILTRDAISQCIIPILQDDHVIAVSGIMAVSNGCKVEKGQIVEQRPPHTPCALFQTLEYMRSFLVGKMGWSTINAMPNVSGGYGLFDKKIVMSAGGYSGDSFAEDMDMIIRMVGYCCDFKRKYRIVQVPVVACWNEVPPNIKVLYNQRVRWGRGLIETFVRHRRFLFNRKYRRLGLVTLPYVFVFELLAPVIEFVGFLVFIYQALTGAVNWMSALVIFLGLYTFCFVLSLVVMFNDYTLGGSFRKLRSYLWIMGAALLEPFLYHPFTVIFSLKGYWNYLLGKRAVWGTMSRKGFSDESEGKDAGKVGVATAASGGPDNMKGGAS